MSNAHSTPARGPAATNPATRAATTARDQLAFLTLALKRGIAQRWKGRRDRDHLASLETRLLADIGIERHDIDSTLGQAPWFYTHRS